MNEAYFGERGHAWFVYHALHSEWARQYNSPKPEDKDSKKTNPSTRIPSPDIDGSKVMFANEQFGRFNALVEKLSTKRHVKVKLA